MLLINLIAAHAKRFRWTWRKLGIHLTHAGLIIMLAGGLFTDLFAVESHMRLAHGDTKNYSEDMRDTELAVIDTSGDDLDQVTAIPDTVLRHNRVIDHWSLPFRIVVRNFYQNSRLKMLSQAGEGARPIANQGPGAMIAVEPAVRATATDERDVPSAAVEILPKDGGSLGTWLVSDALGAPQTFSCGGRTWMIALRPARYYKPYSVTLQKFTHERYAGTEIPKEFLQQSHVDRSGAFGESRRLDLHESSAALSRRDVLSGRISERRFGDDSAGGAQPELHRALRRLRDRRRRSARAIWFSSRRIFAENEGQRPHETFLALAHFAPGRELDRGNWLPPKTAKDDVDLARFGKIPVLVGGRVKPLDTVARNSLLIIHGKQELRLEGGQASQCDAMAHRCSL